MFFVLQTELIVLTAIVLALGSILLAAIKIMKQMNKTNQDFLVLIQTFHKEFEKLEKKVGELKK